jgi:hypothetical protein
VSLWFETRLNLYQIGNIRSWCPNNYRPHETPSVPHDMGSEG